MLIRKTQFIIIHSLLIIKIIQSDAINFKICLCFNLSICFDILKDIDLITLDFLVWLNVSEFKSKLTFFDCTWLTACVKFLVSESDVNDSVS